MELKHSGWETRHNLQPRRPMNGLRPFDDSVVATIASGYEKADVEAVGLKIIWL